MVIKTGANDGNVQLEWAQQTADPVALTVLKGSYLIIKDLGSIN